MNFERDGQSFPAMFYGDMVASKLSASWTLLSAGTHPLSIDWGRQAQFKMCLGFQPSISSMKASRR